VQLADDRVAPRDRRAGLLSGGHRRDATARRRRAFLAAGALLAGVVAVILTVQTPLVTPDFALRDTIVVLAGVVLGGMNRLLTATLGGFAIGFVSGVLGGALPTDQSQYLPSLLFGAVILVLLVRPGGLFARGRDAAVQRV